MSNTTPPGFRIFVVEDDEYYRELLIYTLKLNPDYMVTGFAHGYDCLARLHEKPNVITLDYCMPDMDGMAVLKKIKAASPGTEVIIISEQDKIETAVELLKYGAYDYIGKTDEIRNRLLNTVNHIQKNARLEKQISALENEVAQKYEFEKAIIGNSEAIKKIFSLMGKANGSDITIILTGETGTGKELVAKAIHYNSRRAKMPFVPVNVAAIPKDLIESELFGHEKGAFTGAQARRIGKFEEAHQGTIFLDEIGEMDLTVQAKLLRVLQEKELSRVGGNERIPLDCRVIAATHKDLYEEIKKGNFREDLYYRLLGLQILLPSLRERDKDVLLLAKYFLRKYCEENHCEEYTLTNEALHKLLSYKYPGNVRELKSVIELAAVMCNNAVIDADDISFHSQDLVPEMLSEEITLKDYNMRLITIYLKRYNNNVRLVAEKLDIGMSTIYRMLKEKEEAPTAFK